MPSSDRPQTLEPKYCEGCGALCLRPKGCLSTYCPRCYAMIAAMAPVRLRSDQHPERRWREL